MADPKDNFKEFLLKEYDRYTDLYKYSEDTGEKRLTFYMSLVTAIIGGVVALFARSSVSAICNYNLIAVLVPVSLNGLLVIGYIIQNRLKKRNEHTDNYVRNIDNIRTLFTRANEWTDEDIANYVHYNGKLPATRKRFTNLKDIVNVTNAIMVIFLMLILAYLFLIFFKATPCPAVLHSLYFWTLAVLALISFITLGFHAKVFYYDYWYKVNPTHAGCVVYREIDFRKQYLLISPKVPATQPKTEWVLPKGHIEGNEKPMEAADREVCEETGLKGDIEEYLGCTKKIDTEKEKNIVIKFYLMRVGNTEPESAEGRKFKWCYFKEFMEIIASLPETFEVVKELSNTLKKK